MSCGHRTTATRCTAGGGQFSRCRDAEAGLIYQRSDACEHGHAHGMALAVNNDLPVRSTREFIDYAGQPRKVNYGATARLSSHLAPAAFAAHEKPDMVVRRSGHAAVDPRVDSDDQVFGNISDIVGRRVAAKCVCWRSSAARRAFPDVPTVAETVPGFVMTGWNGYFAPAGTPRSIVDRLAQRSPRSAATEVVKIMGTWR